MEEKIMKATDYVARHSGSGNQKDILNDAANIFADNYEEYMVIWSALQAY